MKEGLESQGTMCKGSKENKSEEEIKKERKEMYENVEKSSRRMEVVYHRETQKPLLTRVYFTFHHEVSWDC